MTLTKGKKMSEATVEIVTISFEELVSDSVDLSEKIFKAYGPDGLGALTISGIPDFLKLRNDLLPLSHKLAHLSDEAKAKVSDFKTLMMQ